MNANELRIGNKILFAEDGTEFTVTDILGNGFNVKNEEENTWIEADQFEGVTLTEEWLLSFGFYKTMSWTYAIELEGNLKLVYYLGEKGWSIGFKSYSDFTNLKYVHQLQNLYFALMGKELIYKNNL
jgi:hypothetical protein